jgi:subtilisin family serine protease
MNYYSLNLLLSFATYVSSENYVVLIDSGKKGLFKREEFNSFQFPNGFSGFSLINPTEDDLKDAEKYGKVYEDSLVYPSSSWGLDRINQDNLPLDLNYKYSDDFKGQNVNVYIIDSGIDAGNPDFEGRAVFEENLTNDGIDSDCNGHGTHVAGTIGSKTYGVAKEVNLIAYKVFPCSGGAYVSTIIYAIEKATIHAVASGNRSVINMSLGGGYSSVLNNAVEASIDSGVHHSVAAGNDNNDACFSSPASSPSAITVGSSNIYDTRSSFSNWGKCVDIFAPGGQIKSWSQDREPWTISGTSMAAPHVSGVMALKLSQKQYTPLEMYNDLRTSSVKNKITDLKTSPGFLLNIEESDFSCTTTETVTQTQTQTVTQTATQTCGTSGGSKLTNIYLFSAVSLILSLF